MANPPPAIEIEGLSKRYGSRLAVDQVSLHVAQGEVFGFLGPNGAGKTTTIAMLLGLVRPSAGRAALLGYDVATQPAQALARVGAMIEAPAFYPYLSADENLRVLCKAGGLPLSRIAPALEAVDLSARAHDKVRVFSQGMKQRLALAATLLPDPTLIILDEPTNGLDPAGTAEVRALIETLADAGRTIFMSSHQLHEVEQVCGRVAILKAGRLIAEGQIAELRQRGQTIRLRVEGDPAPAVALLHQFPVIQQIRQQGALIELDVEAEHAAAINRYLAQHGVDVAELAVTQSSLETFFLEVTNQAPNEGTNIADSR